MNSKKIATALEGILAELKEMNSISRRTQELESLLLTNSDTTLEIYKKISNANIAYELSVILEKLGKEGLDFLTAIQEGNLVKAQEIHAEKFAPKKRGRKPGTTVANTSTEKTATQKRRGRKPRNAK